MANICLSFMTCFTCYGRLRLSGTTSSCMYHQLLVVYLVFTLDVHLFHDFDSEVFISLLAFCMDYTCVCSFSKG